MRRAAALLTAALVAVACSGGGDQRLVVAAGTTLVDSGLMDALAGRFEALNPGVDVSVVGEASAQVLELGRRGAADVLVTHAPALEEQFLAEGFAARSDIAFTSDFVLVAPPEFSFRGSVVEALGAIAGSGIGFVSRGDGSGTHERELELWARAGIDPAGADWYLETGQGMGLTLLVADQRHAATLAERGAYLAASPELALVPLDVDPDPALDNPYRLTVVEGAAPAAAAFAEWLLGEDGRAAVLAVNEELFGAVVYRPPGG